MNREIPQNRDDFDEAVVRRVEQLLAHMGWNPVDLAKRVHKDLGYATPKAVQHFFEREGSRRLHPFAIMKIASTLGVDPAYLMLAHDNLESTMDPDGLYALRSQLQIMRDGNRRNSA